MVYSTFRNGNRLFVLLFKNGNDDSKDMKHLLKYQEIMTIRHESY